MEQQKTLEQVSDLELAKISSQAGQALLRAQSDFMAINQEIDRRLPKHQAEPTRM